MDLTCILSSWWEVCGSSSLATLPWVSSVALFPPLHVCHPLQFSMSLLWRTWVCPSEDQMWRLCSCLGCRVLAALGTQGSWQLGKQEIQCSRRVWQWTLTNTIQYSCLEKAPDRETWQVTAHRVTQSWTRLKHAGWIDARLFFFFFLPVAALLQ